MRRKVEERREGEWRERKGYVMEGYSKVTESIFWFWFAEGGREEEGTSRTPKERESHLTSNLLTW
jgi:hypothetical protein